MTSPSLTPRPERVPFSRAVVVTPLDEGKPELTLVGANLSRGGMFVKSKEMLEPGTKVSLSLEAKGQAFPFAEAEVVWERPMDQAATDSVIPGFGLRFVNFLHPRAPELVDTLLEKAAKKKQKELEQFATPPEKFTELSLDEAPKAKEPKVEAKQEAPEPEKLEAPPLPKRTRTDPEFVKSGESFVIDIQKERADASDDEEEGSSAPPSAFKSKWPKLMGAVAMAPLFLVPLGVAIGTWRASKAPEPHTVIEQAAAAAPTETRTVEFAPPAEQQQKLVDPLAISPAPELIAEESPAKIEKAGTLEDIDPVALVEEKPAVVVAPKPVEVEVAKAQARVEPKPRVEPKKLSTATLPLELAAVKSLSGSLNGSSLELSLAGTTKVRRAFALKSPNRLVIDIGGATPPKSAVHEFTKISGVQRVRVGALPDGVRLVLDLSKSAANVQLSGSKISATLQ